MPVNLWRHIGAEVVHLTGARSRGYSLVLSSGFWPHLAVVDVGRGVAARRLVVVDLCLCL